MELYKSILLPQPRNSNAMSPYGIAGTILGLSLILSLSASTRVSIGPLLVHPYLLIAPFILILLRVDLFKLPNNILTPLVLFLSFCSLAQLQSPNPLPEIVKLASAVFTFLLFAQLVKKEEDFHAIGFSLFLSSIYISVIVVMQGASAATANLSGVVAIEGFGNKNAQGLFILPGFFIGYLRLFDLAKKGKWWIAGLYLVGIAIIAIASIYSANRSGWIAISFIVLGGLIVNRVKIGGIVIVSLLILLSSYLVTDNATRIFERKLNQTTSGYSADDQRQQLLLQSISIGLEHPFLGLGLIGLNHELGVRLGEQEQIDPHNLYGYLLGGGGFFTFFAFMSFLFILFNGPGWQLWFRKYMSLRDYKPQALMRLFILIFLLRSLFTREIIYNPNFLCLMGILYGYSKVCWGKHIFLLLNSTESAHNEEETETESKEMTMALRSTD